MKRVLGLVCAAMFAVFVLWACGEPTPKPAQVEPSPSGEEGAPCFKDLSPEAQQAQIQRWAEGAPPPRVVGDQACNFYDFAWGSFVSLTALTGPEEWTFRFQGWGNSDSLFPAEGAPPPFPGKDFSEMTTVRQLDIHASAALALRKPPQVSAESTDSQIGQAGSIVPLVDQEQRWVYYSVLTNQTEYDFVRSQGLYTEECYNRWGGVSDGAVVYCADTKAVTLACDGVRECPDTKNPVCQADVFPSPLPEVKEGSVELKLAWKILETCNLPDSPQADCQADDPRQFIRLKAVVPPYTEPVALGLVGMHIVSKVPGHKDWVWATFEHQRTAPDCPAPAPDPQQPYLFYGKNENVNMFCTACPIDYRNVWPEYVKTVEDQLNATPPQAVVDGDGNLVCSLNPGAFNLASPPFYSADTCVDGDGAPKPLPATQACRENPIEADVESLNGVFEKLFQQEGSVRQNYRMVGTLWLNDWCGQDPQCMEEGSTALSNITMETFEQVLNPGETPKLALNCLICHGQNQVNSQPFSLKPYASGIADRSFVFHRILQKKLPDGVECAAPRPTYTCATCPKPSSTAGGR